MTRTQAKYALMIICSEKHNLGIARIQDTNDYFLVDYNPIKRKWYALSDYPISRTQVFQCYYGYIRESYQG